MDLIEPVKWYEDVWRNWSFDANVNETQVPTWQKIERCERNLALTTAHGIVTTKKTTNLFRIFISQSVHFVTVHNTYNNNNSKMLRNSFRFFLFLIWREKKIRNSESIVTHSKKKFLQTSRFKSRVFSCVSDVFDIVFNFDLVFVFLFSFTETFFFFLLLLHFTFVNVSIVVVSMF